MRRSFASRAGLVEIWVLVSWNLYSAYEVRHIVGVFGEKPLFNLINVLKSIQCFFLWLISLFLLSYSDWLFFRGLK